MFLVSHAIDSDFECAIRVGGIRALGWNIRMGATGNTKHILTAIIDSTIIFFFIYFPASN